MAVEKIPVQRIETPVPDIPKGIASQLKDIGALPKSDFNDDNTAETREILHQSLQSATNRMINLCNSMIANLGNGKDSPQTISMDIAHRLRLTVSNIVKGTVNVALVDQSEGLAKGQAAFNLSANSEHISFSGSEISFDKGNPTDIETLKVAIENVETVIESIKHSKEYVVYIAQVTVRSSQEDTKLAA